jgi:hypothetical protein
MKPVMAITALADKKSYIGMSSTTRSSVPIDSHSEVMTHPEFIPCAQARSESTCYEVPSAIPEPA